MTFSTCSMVVFLRVDVIGHHATATQDHDAVHHLEDVVDIVGDEDARVARVPSVAHEPQHALRLRHAEVVGRLVKDDELAVEVHGARDGDRLALTAGERADGRLGRDLLGETDLAHEAGGHVLHEPLVHTVENGRAPKWLATQEQVARDGELRHQRRILVDGLHTVGDGIVGVPDCDLLAVEVDGAVRQRGDPRNDLDQRGLARTIVPEQTHDLVRADAEADVFESLDAPVPLVDVLECGRVLRSRLGLRPLPSGHVGMERHHAQDDPPDEDLVCQRIDPSHDDAVAHDA